MKENQKLPPLFRQKEDTMFRDTRQLAAEAEKVLSDLANDYPDQVRADVVEMRHLLAIAKTAGTAEERFTLIREDFFRKVHDMKGQGALFGYPRLSEIGAVVCDYLRHKTEITKADIAWCEPYIHEIEQQIGDEK